MHLTKIGRLGQRVPIVGFRSGVVSAVGAGVGGGGAVGGGNDGTKG